MSLQTKNELTTSRLSKVIELHITDTYIQTDIQANATEAITTREARTYSNIGLVQTANKAKKTSHW